MLQDHNKKQVEGSPFCLGNSLPCVKSYLRHLCPPSHARLTAFQGSLGDPRSNHVCTKVGFLPNQIGNTPTSGTNAPPFLWTSTLDCILYTSKLMTPPSRPLPPSKHSRSFLPSTASTFYTTKVTNGQFADNTFEKACHDSHQWLTFCGVNAHFQNGTAEHAIRGLFKSARKQLLHTCACWPAAIHFVLWLYAL
jgi:hypothetical protein